MPDIGNQGVTISYKGQNGYYPLYPRTIDSQVLDFGIGENFGPYTLTLQASNWVNDQQTVQLEGITANDIPFIVKSLSGTIEEMKKQKEAYNLLAFDGVESIDGGLVFTCDKGTPTVDFNVQVSWNR